LPKQGGVRAQDLPPGDVPGNLEGVPEFEDDDDWAKAKFLLETVADHELLDPMLSSEKLLYRLFHEDGVRVFPDQPLEWHCHCSRERTTAMLQQFSAEDKRYMIKDGQVEVTCEFCNVTYRFAPAELD
jgi:molecular chaperone Hsp33